MNILISTNFSEPRAKTFYRFHYLKMTKARYVFYGCSLLFLIISAFLIFLFEKIDLGIIFLMTSVITLAIRPHLARSTVKKILEKNRVMGFKYDCLFTVDKLIYTVDGKTYDYYYQDIIIVCETDSCLYIYITKDKAIIVPKFALRNDSRDEFLSFLKSKTKYRKYAFRQKDEE